MLSIVNSLSGHVEDPIACLATTYVEGSYAMPITREDVALNEGPDRQDGIGGGGGRYQ